MEDIISYALLALFGSSGMVICTTVYQLSTNIPMDNVLQLSTCVMYLVCVLFQIFVPSHFGTSLRRESETIPYEAFKSNWVVRSRRFKKIMMIFTEQARRPATIKAAGLFELGLITFLKVCARLDSYKENAHPHHFYLCRY